MNLKDFQIYDYDKGFSINAKNCSTDLKLLENISPGSVLAIDIPRSARLVQIIYICLERSIPFFFCHPSLPLNILQPSWLINDKTLTFVSNKSLQNTQLCYQICTSGTTGTPKVISVSRFCIFSNIEDFCTRFHIGRDDKIAFSTSLYFDPSIVELFLPMFSGASILVISDEVRNNPCRFTNFLFDFKPTFLQITPSQLSLLPSSVLSYLLGADSPLRILLIGGEKFPITLINKYRTHNCPTKVFNVYGVTEVSCWSSVFEVPFNCTEVYLGVPLFETSFSLTKDFELCIEGTRKCKVDGIETQITFTGDIIAVTPNGWKYAGRKDNQIKINGIRCHLDALLSSVLEKYTFLINGHFLYWKKCLVLFICGEKIVTNDDLSYVLPPNLMPSKVFLLKSLPVNKNGKVDKNELVNFLENRNNIDDINSFLKKRRIDISQSTSRSFFEYGINSLDAAELALLLGNPELMLEIMSPSATIASILNKQSLQISSFGEASNLICINYVPIKNLKLVFAANLRKCIDGDVAVGKGSNGDDIIICSSHSGTLICISLCSGIIMWELYLAQRIEASPVFFSKTIIAIGGYNGILHFIDVSKGEIIWEYSAGGEIKSPIESFLKTAFVVSYDGYLHKLLPEENILAWKRKLLGPSPICPCVIPDKSIVVCTTIKGSVEAFNLVTGDSVWIYHHQAPIFSKAVISNCKHIIFTSVDGTVNKLNTEGILITKLLLGEPFFAHGLFHDNIWFLAGQKGSVFILDKNMRLLRSFQLISCSFVRPVFLYSDLEFGFMSTDGRLHTCLQTELIDLSTHSNFITFRHCLLSNGQIFSHPCLTSSNEGISYLLVGSRDDWLRCWRK